MDIWAEFKDIWMYLRGNAEPVIIAIWLYHHLFVRSHLQSFDVRLDRIEDVNMAEGVKTRKLIRQGNGVDPPGG